MKRAFLLLKWLKVEEDMPFVIVYVPTYGVGIGNRIGYRHKFMVTYFTTSGTYLYAHKYILEDIDM